MELRFKSKSLFNHRRRITQNKSKIFINPLYKSACSKFIVIFILFCNYFYSSRALSRNEQYFGPYGYRRHFRESRGPNAEIQPIKVISTNVGVHPAKNQTVNGQNLGDFIQLVGINNGRTQPLDVSNLIRVVRIGNKFEGTQSPINKVTSFPVNPGHVIDNRNSKVEVMDGDAIINEYVPPTLTSSNGGTTVLLVGGETLRSDQEGKLNSPQEARAIADDSPAQRLPYDTPYFAIPGKEISPSNGLFSLEDVHGRETHKVQYFVGEKAKDNNHFTLEHHYGEDNMKHDIIDDDEDNILSEPTLDAEADNIMQASNQKIYHINPKVHLPGYTGVLNAQNPIPYMFPPILPQRQRFHINPALNRDTQTKEEPQSDIGDQALAIQVNPMNNVIQQTGFSNENVPELNTFADIQYEFNSEDALPKAIHSDDVPAAYDVNDLKTFQVDHIPQLDADAKMINEVISRETVAHDNKGSGSEQNFISIFANRDKNSEDPAPSSGNPKPEGDDVSDQTDFDEIRKLLGFSVNDKTSVEESNFQDHSAAALLAHNVASLANIDQSVLQLAAAAHDLDTLQNVHGPAPDTEQEKYYCSPPAFNDQVVINPDANVFMGMCRCFPRFNFFS